MDANRLLKKINYLSPNDYENELEFLTKENNEKNSIAFYQRGINNFKKGLINIQKGLEKESIEIFEKTISEFTIAIELQANTKLYLFRGMAHEKIADLVEDDSLSLHHRTRAFDDYDNRMPFLEIDELSVEITLARGEIIIFLAKNHDFSWDHDLQEDFDTALEIMTKFGDPFTYPLTDPFTPYKSQSQQEETFLQIKENRLRALIGKGNANAYYYSHEEPKQQIFYFNSIENYTKALSIDSDQFEAHFGRGRVNFFANDLDAAIEDYTNAIKNYTNATEKSSSKELWSAYFFRGLAKSYLKDFAGSNRDIKSALKILPDSYAAKLLIAKNMKKLKNFKGAIDILSTLIKKFPDHETLYQERSELRKLTKDNKGSKEDLKKFHELQDKEYDE